MYGPMNVKRSGSSWGSYMC